MWMQSAATHLSLLIADLRWDILGGLDPNSGVPFSRGQDGHLIQELVDAREQIRSVLRLVRHVMENLQNQYQTLRELILLVFKERKTLKLKRSNLACIYNTDDIHTVSADYFYSQIIS